MITHALIYSIQTFAMHIHMLDLITFCRKIEPFVIYYKRLIKSYNNTSHNILKNELDLMLPQTPRKQKHVIITTLVSSFIGLAY